MDTVPLGVLRVVAALLPGLVVGWGVYLAVDSMLIAGGVALFLGLTFVLMVLAEDFSGSSRKKNPIRFIEANPPPGTPAELQARWDSASRGPRRKGAAAKAASAVCPACSMPRDPGRKGRGFLPTPPWQCSACGGSKLPGLKK